MEKSFGALVYLGLASVPAADEGRSGGNFYDRAALPY
jgi:hypothetical protein